MELIKIVKNNVTMISLYSIFQNHMWDGGFVSLKYYLKPQIGKEKESNSVVGGDWQYIIERFVCWMQRKT